MWLQHLFSFAGTVLRAFFDAIGTTLLGRLVDLAFAVSIAVAALRSVHREKGPRAMLNHWKDNYKAGVKFALCCAIIIYSPVLYGQSARRFTKIIRD
jgi:ABC-type sulfate transport system permease subunit